MSDQKKKAAPPATGEECARRMTVALERIAVELARIRAAVERDGVPAVHMGGVVADLLRGLGGRG